MADRRYQLGGGSPAMRALSIRQPWAFAIFHLGKQVENRDFEGFNYRGPILIHASKTFTKKAYGDAVTVIGWMRRDIGVSDAQIPEFEQLPSGALCGIARIVGVKRHPEAGVVRVEGYDGQMRELDWGRGYVGYRQAGALGLELADVRELPPIPYKGALGLFTVALDEQGPGYGTPHKRVYEDAWRELEAASRRAE